MKKNRFFKSVSAILTIASLGFFISCSSDNGSPSGPVASFQFEVNENNFLEVSFTNFSQNATSYAWDFGDNTGESTKKNPTYTYGETGTFTVTLVASDDAGATATFSADVTITDPDEALTLLAGANSKTWKLLRDGTAMLLLSAPGGDVYWPGSSNDGVRPCLYDDSFTFTRDGSYIYDDGGTFWAEYGVFNNVAGCDSNVRDESCFEATAANMVNACGDDVSAWLSGTHTYDYNSSTGKITLTGTGAWIGIPKLGTTTDTNITPQSSIEFDAVLVDGGTSGVDTMYVSFTYSGTYWPITYVSYSDPSLEPDLVSINANFGAAANGLEVSFTNLSSGATSYSWDFGDGGSSTMENPVHTYAAAGTYTVELTVSDDAGSTATFSKDVEVSNLTLTDPAPTPTEPSANVISIYSDAYTDITGVDTNPNWGQATVVTNETVQGDNVLLLSGLNYQGIDFSGNMQDVSGKTKIHIDVWTAGATTVNFYLISPGPAETSSSLVLTAGSWNSFDIALTDFSSVVDLTQVMQFKFDDAGSGSSPSIYVDNIYFY